MFTFLEFLFGFLIARLVWDAIKHFSKQCGELPIVWFFKTMMLLLAFFAVVAACGLALIYALRSHL